VQLGLPQQPPSFSEPALSDEKPWDEQVREMISGDDPGASSDEIALSEEPLAPAVTSDALRDLAAALKDGGRTTDDLDRIAQKIEGAQAALTEQEQTRVKNLRGRVATDPNLQPTPGGKPRVQFVLAEHIQSEGDEQTVFHRVYTLNKQAESLQKRGLEKGQQVGVEGYRQQRETKKRDGSLAQGEVIYANVVRTFGRGGRMEEAEATGEEPQ